MRRASRERFKHHKQGNGTARLRCEKLDDQGAAVKADIQQQIRQLQEVLEERMEEPCNQVDQHVGRKKNLAAQKDEVETIETQQISSASSLVKCTFKMCLQRNAM